MKGARPPVYPSFFAYFTYFWPEKTRFVISIKKKILKVSVHFFLKIS